MPKPRGQEMPQRVSPRGPAPLRTSSSDSDPLNHRSPKLGDRRSPRSATSEPLSQKKLGTRIAGLESQLEQAQGELKILKDQLASAEAAKKEAQKELERKTKKSTLLEPASVKSQRYSPSESHKEISHADEIVDDNQKETDVFEVLVEKVNVEPEVEVDLSQHSDRDEVKTKPVDLSAESPKSPSFEEELAVKEEEMNLLKASLEEKEKEIKALDQQNEGLKQQLNDASLEISLAQAKEEKMSSKMNQIEEELKKSQSDGAQLKERLREVEGAKEALETEMKKLRVQTEQWRKAADAAAAILAGGVEMGDGGRISGRCGSMDKHYGGGFEPPAAGGYAGFVGSPGIGDDFDDGFGNGKRKGSGIRMFGDLWKKKGQK